MEPDFVLIQDSDTEDTTITASEALKICHHFGKNITIATLHNWINTYDKECLCHQPKGDGGRYYIFKLAFLRFIKGES